MYLHLGQDTVIRKEEILGIFDIDTSTVSAITRNYLSRKEKEGSCITVSYELPGSFVVCTDKTGKETVYISQLSASTLLKRTEEIY
ncbi:MAG: DUF370 domain-containing protein [Ruminococcaceae bacterium]|nr:DUF370 domain-containing protein [Oscillospiraceae bacterium]